MRPTECFPYKFDSSQLENLEDISIYVGGACNFNCSYCDRDYIKKVGIQRLDFEKELVNFLASVYASGSEPLISFHGGETLLYISTIEKIVQDMVLRKDLSPRFFIQTNGSLILKNKEFFEKYKAYLFVSISYDFFFQKENRTEFDIEETLRFLDNLGIQKQLQYVIPSNQKDAFDIQVFASIIKLYKKYKINSLNLILLRHQRAVDEFKTIINNDTINLKALFSSFIQFVQLLYVSGINVVIDGHSHKIDKQYYSNHKQIVLSPDGYIYPEYQFIEYKHPEFRIGQWRLPYTLNRNQFRTDAVEKIRPACQSCQMQKMCGLQYYYAMFDINPPAPNKCSDFYKYMEFSLTHLFKLKRHKNLLESIGV